MAASSGAVAVAAAVAVLAVVMMAAAAAAVAVAAGEDDAGDQPPPSASCARRPVVFAFGDSNTDTGGIAAGMGFYFPLPEGRAFFRRATGRLCDGRLVIDYLCESLNMSYLSPYLEPLASDFTNGANFAISGAGTAPRNAAFSLHIQVQQFIHFKQRSLELASRGAAVPVDADGFRNALYLIDIGQNDLSAAFSGGLPYDDVVRQRFPAILSEIKDAIQSLYYNGAKNLWIHGTGPLGCLPQKLAVPRADDGDLDSSGCLKTLNAGSYEFNSQLSSICDQLSSQLRGATIVFTDILAIKYELIANHSSYGFEEPLMACCGHGGPPYNYDFNVSCLGAGYRVCEDGSKFVSWDGVHYTDAANAVVAGKILSAEYSRPKLPFGYFCNA
uniref:Esterase n=2 Tax=Oryza punctata TaxID=4537 RepID=A0A0E0JHY6_ORYPU